MYLKKKILSIALFAISLCSISQITDITWQRCFDTDNNHSNTFCISEFNNGYLVGIEVSTESQGVSNYHGNTDSWFVHLDTIGNIIWERCYGGTMGESPIKIIPDSQNNYYLINWSYSNDGDVQCDNHGGADIWVVKINKEGNILWQQCFGGPNDDIPRDAVIAPDGGLLLMSRIFDKGGEISTHYGDSDTWLCKIDSLGFIQWETTIGTPGMDNGWKVIYTSMNTYLALCGVNANGGMSECEMIGSPYLDLDVWLVELDMEGNTISQDCFGGTDWENCYDIIESEDGYAIVSSTKSNDVDVSGNHGEEDIWLLKINKEKQIIWQKCMGGYDQDTPHYITTTDENGYIIMGFSKSNSGDVSGNHLIGNNDIWMAKTNNLGEIQWQHCFGGAGNEWFWGGNCVLQKNEDNYVIAPITNSNSGDVDCAGSSTRGWIFEIKDCHIFTPGQTNQPTGKDTLCINTDSITIYTTTQVNHAWYYEWELAPSEAGTVVGDSMEFTIHWNSAFEGTAVLKVRGVNDCGEGEWSDSLIIQTYTCLDVENIHQQQIYVYPNPASNKIYIESDEKTNQQFHVRIFNSIGNTAFTSMVLGKTEIDVSCWPEGIYVLSISGEGFKQTKKIVIQ